MDIKIFTKMLKDKHFTDYRKLKYKYSDDFSSFLNTLEELYYKPLPIVDFEDNNIVFIENHASVNKNTIKRLLKKYDYPPSEMKGAVDKVIAQCELWVDEAA